VELFGLPVLGSKERQARKIIAAKQARQIITLSRPQERQVISKLPCNGWGEEKGELSVRSFRKSKKAAFRSREEPKTSKVAVKSRPDTAQSRRMRDIFLKRQERRSKVRATAKASPSLQKAREHLAWTKTTERKRVLRC
jgi:hypothetical protein